MLQRLLLSAAVSLLLTEAVELAGAYAFGVRDKAGLRIVFIANLLTNPAVVLFSILVPRYVFPDCSYGALVAGLELAAWLAEALIYVKYRRILFPELSRRQPERTGETERAGRSETAEKSEGSERAVEAGPEPPAGRDGILRAVQMSSVLNLLSFLAGKVL